MAGFGKKLFTALLTAALGLVTVPAIANAGTIGCTTASDVTTCTGSFNDGATFKLQSPLDWNHTLVLYSHGYVTPGSPNPALDAGDPLTAGWLLGHGYALAGSSYASTGWAIKDAFVDQTATLDAFATQFGAPTRTIAWGHSLGGIITAGLLQKFPDRFTAALPMCGVLAGGVGTWNQGLDAEFAIQQLLAASSGLEVVNLGFPNFANLGLAESVIGAAQQTAQGRARLALAAALGDLPGWISSSSPEPASTDFASQELNQYLWISSVDAPFLFFLRGELEARAGGNPSWNTGVNYGKQLEMSVDYTEVQALYAATGLSLDADLATLAAAPRITTDSSAVDFLAQNIDFNGDLGGKPVLSIHTTGDGLVVVQDEQAYRSVALDAKDGQLLRQAFVHRAGHCTFTPAETIAAFQALVARIDTGKWTGQADPSNLDASAAALGPVFNLAPPAYIAYDPAPFLRPSDEGTH